jgi:putative transcriptional regulator
MYAFIAVDTRMPIRWRLAVLMAELNLDNKDLVAATGLHATTISKLKTTREMPPRLDRDTLERLCKALQCQPGDLLRYEPDIDNA